MNKLKQNINRNVFSLFLRRVGVLSIKFRRTFTMTSFGMAALVMAGSGWIPATQAEVILQVDVSDPSNVTFEATNSTSNTLSSPNLSMNAGITVNDFFTTMFTNINADTPVTGDLNPGQPLGTDTYNLTATFDFSANSRADRHGRRRIG